MSERKPPREPEIRRSAPADAEGVWRCLDAVAKERIHIAMVEAPSLEQVRAFLAAMGARSVIQFVAVLDGEVIGWCDVTPKPTEGFRHSAVLGMGILAAHRRRGLGGELLRTVLDAARSEGISRIELEVYTNNAAAVALYERFGFDHEGVKRAARLFEGRAEDVLCMALLLPPLGGDGGSRT